jgi:hypothetical protein
VRIAWFCPPSSALAELPLAHAVEVFDRSRACDFVWKHARTPYELCVYELGADAAHDFVYAYLFHYPGVLVLDAGALDRHAIAASRMVVVSDAATAEVVQLSSPSAPVRPMPVAAAAVDLPATTSAGEIRFAVLDPALRGLAARALTRARSAGAPAAIVPSLADADVVIAMRWPATRAAIVDAAAAMSAGRPVIAYESDAVADWPALDPQTWQPRGYGDSRPPIVVSVDPRDDEHSLMLAMRRLSTDAALRTALGAAGHAWWRAHATPAHAAAAWNALLDEAAMLPAPPPTSLPASLVADGTERARELLAPFAVNVDFLNRES